MDAAALFTAIVGSVLLAWLPGWRWSRVLLPDLSLAARIVTSVALSIALMTLGLYLLNVAFGVRLSVAATVALSLGLALLAETVRLAGPVARAFTRSLDG